MEDEKRVIRQRTPRCKHNEGVLCEHLSPVFCVTCGWSLEVEKERKKKLREDYK